MCWCSSCTAKLKTRLKFKGRNGSALNGLLHQGNKKNALHELMKHFKEHRTVVNEHNRSVSSNWPPLLPSRGQMSVRATRTNPAALLCVVYLYTGSALNQRTDTVHFHRFTLSHIHTVYSRFEACRKHVIFR